MTYSPEQVAEARRIVAEAAAIEAVPIETARAAVAAHEATTKQAELEEIRAIVKTITPAESRVAGEFIRRHNRAPDLSEWQSIRARAAAGGR